MTNKAPRTTQKIKERIVRARGKAILSGTHLA